ncbi:SOH1-domain-containing protein [Suhomyces tanzawaensis NRRL Y-17324]|uniref:Acyl-coenzyme A diphosphatase SCS3 n=1 Tax=Suhomyces tanzawaensis NRRL Y-17324 TaxID=984487 RepID=A0A1E4SHN3_9ASCO|nr:SOH1-domain-containing protein [Suhomyces tanzawaensis NRRL Y-17324]ODV78995.1 SOH1-domain-containing protein [Suhomyces tanzawaensis NRRL Y-17324]
MTPLIMETLPTRWEIELEFVQSLCNIQYLQYLTQNNYLKDERFIEYLKYLRYWQKPEYAKYLVYPNCLHVLLLLQNKEFRDGLVRVEVVEGLMNEMVGRWAGTNSNGNETQTNGEAEEVAEKEAGNEKKEPIEMALKVSPAELLFLVSFLANFVVGKIVHYFSPDEEVYSYYTNKKNFINQLFVKRGWGWTTLFVAVFYALVLTRSKPAGAKREPMVRVIGAAAVRYALVTLWWVLFTQWCFGLPLMDKIFVWTGGKCEVNSVKEGFEELFEMASHPFNTEAVKSDLQTFTSTVVSSYQCRRLKGSWTGGHDPSGHVFLMIHSSLYMFLEGLPFWASWTQLWNETTKVARQIRHENRWNGIGPYVHSNPHILFVALIGLWWFMLFMTNVYFHSIAEKFVGLLFGYLGIFAVYYAPRWLATETKKNRVD